MTSTKPSRMVFSQENNARHSGGDLTYGLATLFLRAMRIIPASQRIASIDKLGALVGKLLYTLNMPVARTIRANMRAVLGSSTSNEPHIRRLLSMTVWNALMLNSLPMLPRQQVATLAELHGHAHLDEGLKQGAVVIWGYHFGIQPLVVAAILHAHGYPVHAIARARQMPSGASQWHQFYLKQLTGVMTTQIPIIDPREGVQREILTVLQRQAGLYITPDYMVLPAERATSAVSIDFLGQRPYVQTGGLRLAKRLKASFVTVMTDSASAQRSLVLAPWTPLTDSVKPEALREDLQALLAYLEDQVRQAPNLWLDFKRDDLLARLGSEENVNHIQE